MATYKGVEVDAGLRPLIRHMEAVNDDREVLQRLQAVWDNLALLGQLSGMATDLAGTRQAFADLTTMLLDTLAMETRRKRAQELAARAQVAIDILARNLFERTADIGFLATDEAVCRFAAACADGEPDPAMLAALVARFHDYVRKYSVYDDIVLLAADGRVLARLGAAAPQAPVREPWLLDALQTRAPYVEYHGPSALFPDLPASLCYACRVGDGATHGVLCLRFRLADEAARIFAHLDRAGDWAVLALVDGDGRVIASSDPQQLPPAGRVPLALDGDCRVVRLAGREYLALTRRTAGYQGYAGPGWLGQVMVPLEYAFEAGESALALPPAVMAAVTRSDLFPAALREIPQQAERIQRELNRSVWNGRVRQSRDEAGANGSFSKVLLGEIGRIGSQTSEVFARAIANLQQTVVSAVLDDSAFFAALAIDIMDRNLYERANDCRWWALTACFNAALQGGDASTAEEALAQINGLYTVYDNLLLFDRRGRIVAVSNPNYADRVGTELDEEWVARTLGLTRPQRYVVSAFAATPLYANRPTYIHAAAVLDGETALGGIATVFDAEPQFMAMLRDALPAVPGAFAAFAAPDGRVIASTHPQYPAGSRLPLVSGVVQAIDGHYYAVGHADSQGYREYKGPDDDYRNPVRAWVFIPLGPEQAATEAAVPEAVSSGGTLRGPARGEPVLELATFRIGDEWLGLVSRQVVEALDPAGITSLPGMAPAVRGVLMRGGQPVPVYDLALELRPARMAGGDYRQVIVIEDGHGALFGILAHALADTLEIPLHQVDPISGLFPGQAPLAESVVRPDPAQGRHGILIVLSVERVRERLMHTAPAALSARIVDGVQPLRLAQMADPVR